MYLRQISPLQWSGGLLSLDKSAYAVGRRGSCFCPLPWRSRGQKVPFISNSFFKFMSISNIPILRSGIFLRCRQFCFKKLFWGNPRTPKLLWHTYENNMLNSFLLKENLKTKSAPCGGTLMYIDVSLVKALPPCFRYVQTLCLHRPHILAKSTAQYYWKRDHKQCLRLVRNFMRRCINP